MSRLTSLAHPYKLTHFLSWQIHLNYMYLLFIELIRKDTGQSKIQVIKLTNNIDSTTLAKYMTYPFDLFGRVPLIYPRKINQLFDAETFLRLESLPLKPH